MLNVMKKYAGVLFFYLVIVAMILLINLRFSKLDNASQDNCAIAMSK